MMRKMLLALALVAAGTLFAAEPPVFIDAGKVPNMRDLGGWTGLDGRKVRTGQIYRSAGLNDNASAKKVVTDGVTNKVMKAGKTRIDASIDPCSTVTKIASFVEALNLNRYGNIFGKVK